MFTFTSKLFHIIFKEKLDFSFSEYGFIRYVNNIQWFAVAKIISLIISFLTTIIIARLLKPELFGTLNYILSFVGLFAVIANLGIGNVLYRELILHKEEREKLLGSAISLNLIMSAVAFLLITVSLFFIHESFGVKSLIFLMSFSLITQPLTLLSFDFLKDGEGKYVTIAQVITVFIVNVAKIISVYLFLSLETFITILVLENIIVGLIYIYQIKKIKRRSLSFSFNVGHMLNLFYLSLPMALYGIFSEIYTRIDQIMLRHYLDMHAVGFYSAGARLTELWYIIPNILLAALFPALTNVKNNQEEYRKRFSFLFYTLTILALCISFVVFLLRDVLVRIIYGNDFLVAAPLLGVYIFSLLGYYLSLLIFQDFFLSEKKWLIVILPLSIAILNVILNIILIPQKGALGAALATVISYNVTPLFFIALKKFRTFKP